MSRTDVHRPVWVQMQDPTIRHWFADFHDHDDGVCDFGEYGFDHFSPPHCYRQIWTQCPNLCGCHLCTEKFGRRLKRRQERGIWRKLRQQLLKLGKEDLDNVDVGSIRGSAY